MKHLSYKTKKLNALFATMIFGLFQCPELKGSTLVWNVDLNFNEFEGVPGGFEDDRTPVTLQSRTIPSAGTRSYDVLKSNGQDSGGNARYIEGQDGQTDMTITPRVIDENGGRWFRLEA